MTHPLDSSSLDSIADYPGIFKPRPVKLNNGGIGGGGGKNRPKFKHTSLRLVSPKQAARNRELHKKLKRMLIEMELHGQRPACQKCGRAQIEGKNMGQILVADHVQTRNEWDAGRYENLGVLCWSCNSKKASVREDYRPEWFKARMEALDRDP